jgi:hypothetical protein
VWRACNLTAFIYSSTVPVVHLYASCHEGPGFNPQGDLCETGILQLVLPRYIGDPNVTDHCGLVWGVIHPEPSLRHRANNVIIPLDLTQLFCPGFTLTAGPPSSFTIDLVGCCGEPSGEPAISLHLYTVPLVQRSTHLLPVMRDPGSIPRGVLAWYRDSPDSIVFLQKLVYLYKSLQFC